MNASKQVRNRIRVAGVVQGVGFRPFIWRRARQLGLVGWVHNDSCGLTIEVQGNSASVAAFLNGFESALPPLARIDVLESAAVGIKGDSDFLIIDSLANAHQSTPVLPDISICNDCLCEINDVNDRRFRYPFINCTNCGPRFTIIEDIPYDRPLTTMKSFSMCELCRHEYEDPRDRRFHAQPIACPACGPQIWFVRDALNETQFESPAHAEYGADRAIQKFRAAIKQGLIVAVKGVGGFHLACDAANSQAIALLRRRKGRSEKPLAVMVRDLEQARTFAAVSSLEQSLLQSRARPIVLLRRREQAASSTTLPHISLSPANGMIGVMLPYSPLHYLLLEHSAPLVMTSANIAEEPIVHTNQDARGRLGAIADGFLLHNREIQVACDDSVFRCFQTTNGPDRLLPMRRSRGFAPLPVQLGRSGPEVLAVGGELKVTFCVTKNDYAYLSQHVGDMGNVETLHAMRRDVNHLLRLFRVQPAAIIGDLHPGYLSTGWARDLASRTGVPFLQFQHHHAHIAALRAEHRLPDGQPIIGCCFDGTGFGTDGTIWGGEFMIADGLDFHRFAHLKKISLPGGDASIRKPYKVALAHLYAADLAWFEHLPCTSFAISEQRDGLKLLRRQLENGLNCVATSSMGRLFDAVASLIGIRHVVHYEAQAAMELEALATTLHRGLAADDYAFSIRKTSPIEIEWAEMLKKICADQMSGVAKQLIAAKFHEAVASMASEVCVLAREETGIRTVGLTGGVFQNVLLLKLAAQRLSGDGFDVLMHSVVPPNDAGIALGQALIARNHLGSLD